MIVHRHRLGLWRTLSFRFNDDPIIKLEMIIIRRGSTHRSSAPKLHLQEGKRGEGKRMANFQLPPRLLALIVAFIIDLLFPLEQRLCS